VKVTHTTLPGVLLIEPRIFSDDRGHLLETYQAERYCRSGIPPFVQDNLSYSGRGVLRGLHYQLGRPQGKLVCVLAGEVFDVVVDIRRGSPTFGRWLSMVLDSRSYRQLYVPPGFAHGFCVTGEAALVLYKCTDYYAPQEERGLRWNDPALGIDWPVAEPLISPRDRDYPDLRQVPAAELPEMQAEP
jgi:dTDP-4-dehydrorhamnose 3,5-epimerase